MIAKANGSRICVQTDTGQIIDITERLHLDRRIETNSHADPERANNGGGYSQPLYQWHCDYEGHRIDVEFEDSSCGDFGSRYHAAVTVTNLSTNQKNYRDSWAWGSTLEEHLRDKQPGWVDVLLARTREGLDTVIPVYSAAPGIGDLAPHGASVSLIRPLREYLNRLGFVVTGEEDDQWLAAQALEGIVEVVDSYGERWLHLSNERHVAMPLEMQHNPETRGGWWNTSDDGYLVVGVFAQEFSPPPSDLNFDGIRNAVTATTKFLPPAVQRAWNTYLQSVLNTNENRTFLLFGNTEPGQTVNEIRTGGFLIGTVDHLDGNAQDIAVLNALEAVTIVAVDDDGVESVVDEWHKEDYLSEIGDPDEGFLFDPLQHRQVSNMFDTERARSESAYVERGVSGEW